MGKNMTAYTRISRGVVWYQRPSRKCTVTYAALRATTMPGTAKISIDAPSSIRTGRAGCRTESSAMGRAPIVPTSPAPAA